MVNFEKILSVLGKIFDILSPFIFGIILAFVLNILINFIENRVFGKVKPGKVWKKIKRPISLTSSLLAILVMLCLIINLLIPQLRNSVVLFTDTLPEYKDDVINIMNKFNVEEKTVDKVTDYLDNFDKAITDYIKDNSKDVITVTTEVATSVVKIISKAIIGIVFAIYVIAQKENLVRQFNKLMNAYFKPKTVSKVNNVAKMANKTFSNFVTGQCIEAVIFGGVSFIGLLIFGIPYAPTVAVLLGFTALIPVFGAFIGTILSALLICMVNPVKAVIFIAFIIIWQQIETNVIYPKVVGKSIGLPGMWVLLSVTVGASVAGILGMLIATPLCSLLYALFSEEVNARIRENKIVSKVEEKTST